MIHLDRMTEFDTCSLRLTIYDKSDILIFDESMTFLVPCNHNHITHLQTEILPDILLDFELELSDVFYEIN